MAYGDSTADSLTAVRAAIDKALNSQEYQQGRNRQVRARLDHLMMLEQSLLQRQQAESNGGQMSSVGMFTRPT